MPSRPVAALAPLLLLTACAAPAAFPTTAASAPDGGFGHVHGVEVNPADGAVYVATHTGVYRVDDAGPQRIADRRQDTMGFTLVGPDTFLGSGHPDPREPGPPHLGLIRSDDAAASWQPVALAGEADFHALTASGDTVHGWNSATGELMSSDDGGTTWRRGAAVAAADVDLDPRDPARLLVTTGDGLQVSTDAGATLGPADEQPPQLLVLVDHLAGGPALAGVDVDGGVWTWPAEGPWARVGELGGSPAAFTAADAQRFVAATEQGVLESTDAGRSWRVLAGTDRT